MTDITNVMTRNLLLCRKFPHKSALSRFAKSAECTASRFTELVIASYRSLYGDDRRSRSSSCAQRVRQRSMIEPSMSFALLNCRLVASQLTALQLMKFCNVESIIVDPLQ